VEFPTVRASTVQVVDATLRGPEQLRLANPTQAVRWGGVLARQSGRVAQDL